MFRSFSGVIRHTTFKDSLKILSALCFSSGLACIISYFIRQINPLYFLNIPFSVILIHFLLCSFVLVNTRFLIKLLYYQLTYSSKDDLKVLIYGAGNLGIITRNTLTQSSLINYSVVGFVDDNLSKQGKSIDGVKVYSTENALNKKFLENEEVSELVMSVHNIPAIRKRDIVDMALALGLNVKDVPPIEKWLHGELQLSNIHNISIEELLGRECIVLDKENIEKGITGKRVLITGAAGSIGSEIVRQVLYYHPEKLILLDQAETPMNDLALEIAAMGKKDIVELILGDVSDIYRLETVFRKHEPKIVFHAAAYKHVPVMEMNPYESIHVNVKGTRNVADLSVKYKIERFVMISTDKAVNPTNVMGASKRIAEMYTAALNKTSAGITKFIITRFGNVLGSNGSVIPLFRKQIEAGGPITLTHPEITRFFMTIPEACQLVLEAAFMGREGEIFVFDMGESVKIIDLAKKMIKLAGLTLDKDIEIKITGLRPGEKLYEELLANRENTLATHHPKIMIGKVTDSEPNEVIKQINELIIKYQTVDEIQLVALMKVLVPEFLSKNSIYSELDHPEKDRN